MGYVEGESRKQQVLFPEAIDDYITDDNPVRFIDAFVGSIDLEGFGFKRSKPAATGRPPFHPADLLKLYIYGYLNQIRSSRRLEKETHRNVELMWLLRKLKPDFKTIADFRKDNAKAFKQVFRQFNLLCKQLDLFGGELIAIDGSKFKAVNNRKKNFTKSKLKKALKEIDERIEKYLTQLDEADKKEAAVKKPTAEELMMKILQLKENQEKHEKIAKQMQTEGSTQVSVTDPDSRSFAQKFEAGVGYNVQSAVDDKHKLIVEQDVTNDVTDVDQLSKMAIEAKKTLGVKKMKVVADKGYYNGREVKACKEANIEAYISKPITSANTKAGLIGKESFNYDAKHDCYWCPAGQKLTYRFDTHELGRHIRYYATSACKNCHMKAKCTRSKEGRRITRWVHEDILDAMQKRVEANSDLMEKRKTIVEHPFGTIKHWNDQGHFLMKGLIKVRAEMSLTALAYNLKRAINTIGVAKMIQALS